MNSKSIGGVLVVIVLCLVMPLLSCVSSTDYHRKQEEAQALKAQCDKLIEENVALKTELAAKSVQPAPPPPVEIAKKEAVLNNTNPQSRSAEGQKVEVPKAGAPPNEILKPAVAPAPPAPQPLNNTVKGGEPKTVTKALRALPEKKPSLAKRAAPEREEGNAQCGYKLLRKKLAADVRAKRLYLYEQEDTLAITVPGDILFSPGEIRIKKPGKTVLKRVTNAIKNMGDKRFHILGHTDDTPLALATRQEYRDNNYLSMLRAESVMNYLVENGVSAAAVAAVGYGSAKPLKSNKTSQERAFNRRVVIVITDKSQ